VASHFAVHGNIVANAAADGISAAGIDGVISDNVAPDATGDGIDLGASNKIKVCGNQLTGAGAYGIATASVSHSQIHDNDVSGASTGGVQRASTNSDIRIYDNEGANGTPPAHGYFRTDGRTITLPENFLQTGDRVHIWSGCTASAAASGYFQIKFDGAQVGASRANNSTFARIVHVWGTVRDNTSIDWYAVGHTEGEDPGVGLSTITGYDFTDSITVVTANPNATSQTYLGLHLEVGSQELQ
jgi:hypothetical protein